mgnify:CR=1 FL=1
MKTLHVALGERSYPIYIGEQLLSEPDLFAAHIKGKEVLIVTNETVAPLYLDDVKSALTAYRLETVILPDGEQYKTLEIMQRIFDGLLQARMSRQATIIALGGGVIGDMAGFEPIIRTLNPIQNDTLYNGALVTYTEESISKFLGRYGYAYPKVTTIPDINDEDHTVKLSISVDPGKRIYVNRINIECRYNEHIISR